MWAVWILLAAVSFEGSWAAPKTFYPEIKHGNQLKIKLASNGEKLEFTPSDESRTITLYSRHTLPKRGKVVGSGEDRHFVINSVNYDDQGTYKVLNFWNAVSSTYLVKVFPKYSTIQRVAGETLSISTDGLAKNNVTLSFSGEEYNLTLVEHGKPVGNTHPDYLGRIQVSNSYVQVQNVNVSDEGNYRLSDGKGRKVLVVNMILVERHEHFNASPLAYLLLLLGVPAGVCCCCRKKIFKKRYQSTASTTVATAVKYDGSVTPAGPAPAYHNPADPAGPTQVYYPYGGPHPANYNPGYPAQPESAVYPPANPSLPPQPPHSGQPGLYPVITPKPPFNPEYNNQNPAYPPASGLPSPQPPQWGAAPYNPMSPAPVPAPGFGPVMYHAPPGPETIKSETASTPLLPPSQPGAAQPPVPYTSGDVLSSSDSAVQFNIGVGKNTTSNFL